MQAPPDGYTVLLCNTSMFTINPHTFASLPYDPDKSFRPISNFLGAAMVMAVNASVPASNVAEFVAWTKANPGKVNYASAGAGTAHHLAGELFKLETKTEITHVPYRGAGPAMQDLLAGNADMMFDGMGTSAQQIKAGKLKGLAVATQKRVPEFPDMPTAAEIGVPNWLVSTWYGLWAIKGTPQPIVDRLYKEYTAAAQTPEIQKLLSDQGLIYIPNTTAQFQAQIVDEIKANGELAKILAIKGN